MHYSVLLEESIDGLNIQTDGVYIDGTFGRGGHSKAILKKLGREGKLIAFDRDPDAVAYANTHFDAPNFSIVHAPFSHMHQHCEEHNLIGKVDGILLDLGVSSPQLDVAERGFSFSKLGPLDMRMDPTKGISAKEVLEKLSDQELADIFRNFGEERHAWKIAKSIKAHLLLGESFNTTIDLADFILKTIGKREKKHPATRVFQALRIYVNQELDEVHSVLKCAYDILAVKGRLSIITFHSLEDRIVKQFMVNMTAKQSDKSLPRHLPIMEEKPALMKWVVKKAKATDNELEENIRSRSAMLRVVEKL